LAAVQKEGVAGALINQPSDFIALASGFSSLGLSTDYVDNFQYTITGVRRDWAKKNQALVVRFLRAYVKACEFFYEPKNKEDAVHALAERTKETKRKRKKPRLYIKPKTIPRDGGGRARGTRWQRIGKNSACRRCRRQWTA
jgi:ABC-type nitrate/sulfonate/bicarbonate transport system substrate-binding protein